MNYLHKSDRKLTDEGYVINDNSEMQTAMSEWCSNQAAAEAKYGHISTWKTGQVTSMRQLIYSHCSTRSTFNADISNWDGKCSGRVERLGFVSHHPADS